MQVYIIVAVAVVAFVALAVGGALLGRYLWARAVRGRIVRLIGRREAIRAAERTLGRVVSHLAEAPDAELVGFATDAGHEDRRSLAEVSANMNVQAEDLIGMPLPKTLWAAGELLADAAWRVGREARRVTEPSRPDDVFDRLGAVDLLEVRQAVAAAEDEIERLEELHAVDEAAVYGGGLYI